MEIADGSVCDENRYYYYLMTTAGYKIWWKKYLTTLQISQFVIDLFVVYFASPSSFGLCPF